MKRIVASTVLVSLFFASISLVSARNISCSPVTQAETYYTSDGPYLHVSFAGGVNDTIPLDAKPILVTVSFDQKFCVYLHATNSPVLATIFVPTFGDKEKWESAIREVQESYMKYLKSQERQFPTLTPMYKGRK